MTKPLVSVVMPVFKCNPAFLKQSVDSILGQTLSNFELILITDNVKSPLEKSMFDALEEFKADSRLRIITNKGREGFVEALNTGILASKGKYIARMDGDDISLPNRLELQVEALEKRKMDLVGGWAHVIDEKGQLLGRLTPPTEAHSIRKMIMVHNPFIHSSVIFKKSILPHTGLYNPKLLGAEDYELWMRVLSLGYVCVNLPRYVLQLRETRNSIVRGKKWRSTRVNYAKAKVFGLTKCGYSDPLSIAACFLGLLFHFMTPRTTLRLKSSLRWFDGRASIERDAPAGSSGE